MTFEEWFWAVSACSDAPCGGASGFPLSLPGLQVSGLAGLALSGVGYICDIVLFLSFAC
jgi:hypothetical protein